MSQSAECGATVVPSRTKHGTGCSCAHAGCRRTVRHGACCRRVWTFAKVGYDSEVKELSELVHFGSPAPRREHVKS